MHASVRETLYAPALNTLRCWQPLHMAPGSHLTSVQSCACRGALQLASPEVKFEIDRETHDPLDVGMYQVSSFTALAGNVLQRCPLLKSPLAAGPGQQRSDPMRIDTCLMPGPMYGSSKCPCLLYSLPPVSCNLCVSLMHVVHLCVPAGSGDQSDGGRDDAPGQCHRGRAHPAGIRIVCLAAAPS